MEERKVKLELEDGTTFDGQSFGYEKSTNGEVVFNTSMAGYPESLSDPSYSRQILVLTYPLIGNYGVPGYELENNLLRFFESDKVQISALIVSDYSYKHQHWNAQKSLAEWLKEHKIPALTNVDTRALTKHIREHGAMPGRICFDETPAFYDPNQDNMVEAVSTNEVVNYGESSIKILLVDCGVKNNIIRCFLKRGVQIKRVPWDYDFTMEDYDGLFISNGPGDPKKCTTTINNLKTVMQSSKPIFGICLGNQLMALASGADTYKLKYGHRSHNQPVIKTGTNKCYITSQNHGFAIDLKSLQKDWDPLFLNVNDNTCEGIQHKSKPFFAVQFHPEASSGPVDTEFLFDEFIDLIKKQR